MEDKVDIRFVVVSIGVVIAMAAGALASTVGFGMHLAAWLAVGLVPVTWTLVNLLERAIGRDLWHYSAPYPYGATEVEERLSPLSQRRHRRAPRPRRLGHRPIWT
jgi:hypothetical protein